MKDKREHKNKNSVAKSAIYFASGTMMSRMMGLVRDALLVAVFGQTVSDAWLAAFRFPNLFRRIFGEGALSACFIPLYVEYRDREDIRSLSQLTAGVLGLLLCVLIPVNFLFVLGMDSIIASWVHGKGFSDIPGKVELTVRMTKIMFPFLLLMVLYAYLMAILNAHKKFLLSSLAPLFFNVIIVLASLYCYWSDWVSADFLSWSVIVGGVVQFVSLIPSFLKLKVPFDWQWSSLTSLPVRRVLHAFLPSVFGLGIIQFTAFVNVSFASQLPEGTVTAIYLADRLLELPLSMVAVSLGTALLPTLSEQISRRDETQFRLEFFKNIKILLLLCVPAAVGLWVTSSLTVAVLFERGAFTKEQGLVVTQIVQIYAFTLIGASLSRLFGQAFYAEKKNAIPAWASFVGFLFHISLAPIFMKLWQTQGLIISTALSAFVNCLILMVWYYSRHGVQSFFDLLAYIFKMLLASFPILVIGYSVEMFYQPETFWQKLITLSGIIVWGVVSFFLFAKILRVQEADLLLHRLLRWRRRPS